MIESSAERTQLFVLLINVALLLTDGTNVEKQSSAKLKQVWGFTGELGGGIKGFPQSNKWTENTWILLNWNYLKASSINAENKPLWPIRHLMEGEEPRTEAKV